MTNKEKLRALKTLLRYKKNWTQGTFARDKQDCSCEPESRRAVSWCLYGACEKVGLRLPAPLFEPVLTEGIAHFNDNPKTTHANILRAIDRAIKVCKT